nr:hypothetical protein [Gammaproteobacteria bacterium]
MQRVPEPPLCSILCSRFAACPRASANAQRFRLEPSVAEKYDVRDISAETIPEDFARNPKIHRCYEIRARR